MFRGYVGVSLNGGTPKSSILIGFSITNHPFWGTTIFGNTHVRFREGNTLSGFMPMYVMTQVAEGHDGTCGRQTQCSTACPCGDFTNQYLMLQHWPLLWDVWRHDGFGDMARDLWIISPFSMGHIGRFIPIFDPWCLTSQTCRATKIWSGKCCFLICVNQQTSKPVKF